MKVYNEFGFFVEDQESIIYPYQSWKRIHETRVLTHEFYDKKDRDEYRRYLAFSIDD